MGYKFNPFIANFDEVANYSALNLLGTVANAAALPGGATTGDVYQAEDTKIFYVWDGAAWDNIGTLAGPKGDTGDTGAPGAAGADGADGAPGADGVGVVAGGTTGQALVKASNTDYDTQWADVTAVAALDDLTDVVITTPSDGQVLEYDSVSGQWINATPTGGSGTPGGADTQIQYNSSGSFAGSADLTWDDTAKELGVGGDINLDDGGTFATTLQLITPTANRTISFPDATGTVALVGGSSGQLVYNNAGAYAGAPSTSVGATGNITLSLNGAADMPPVSLTGTWFSGGTSTTTKPQLLIEPTGTTSTAWSTSGTGLGVNAPSGFAGNLLDLQVNGSSRFKVDANGATVSPGNAFFQDGFNESLKLHASYGIAWQAGGVGDGTINTTRLSQTSTAGFGVELTTGVRLGAPALHATTGYTVATLPTSPVVGMITRVTDASSPTLGATVSGGGSAAALVWYNGANWTVLGV